MSNVILFNLTTVLFGVASVAEGEVPGGASRCGECRTMTRSAIGLTFVRFCPSPSGVQPQSERLRLPRLSRSQEVARHG